VIVRAAIINGVFGKIPSRQMISTIAEEETASSA